MKKAFAFLCSLLVAAMASIAFAGPANATDESAATNLTMTPQGDKLYKAVPVPVNWRVDVEVTAPASSPQVMPMKRVDVQFPKDMSFNPDDKKTPPCPADKIGPDVNLSIPPDAAIARCPDSVVGNGTAELYLAKNNSPTGPTLKDPVLLVFNGGRDNNGDPQIRIYGYSKQTNYGVYMHGTLQDGRLNVAIPRLSFDSAVGNFNLNIPGTNAPEANRRGQDKNFVQAKCSTGKWITDATFTLGARNDANEDEGPTSTITAPQLVQDCVALPGGPPVKFGPVKVKGPKSVKKGKKGTFKVTIKNNGETTASGVKVGASGKGAKGSANAGSISAGSSKTVKVKVKFTKKGVSKVKFQVKSGKSSKAKVFKVKVK
jgi:hypothetical protein